VPRERVRLDKDTVTDEERVAEELRKEQIDLDDDGTEAGRQERRRRR
jgi:stress response protein YsnF